MWMDPNAGVSEQVSEHLQADRRPCPHLLGAEQEANFIGIGILLVLVSACEAPG